MCSWSVAILAQAILAHAVPGLPPVQYAGVAAMKTVTVVCRGSSPPAGHPSAAAAPAAARHVNFVAALPPAGHPSAAAASSSSVAPGGTVLPRRPPPPPPWSPLAEEARALCDSFGPGPPLSPEQLRLARLAPSNAFWAALAGQARYEVTPPEAIAAANLPKQPPPEVAAVFAARAAAAAAKAAAQAAAPAPPPPPDPLRLAAANLAAAQGAAAAPALDAEAAPAQGAAAAAPAQGAAAASLQVRDGLVRCQCLAGDGCARWTRRGRSWPSFCASCSSVCRCDCDGCAAHDHAGQVEVLCGAAAPAPVEQPSQMYMAGDASPAQGAAAAPQALQTAVRDDRRYVSEAERRQEQLHKAWKQQQLNLSLQEQKQQQTFHRRADRISRIQAMYYVDLLATVPAAVLPLPPSVFFPATRARKVHTASGPAGVQPESSRCPACARG